MSLAIFGSGQRTGLDSTLEKLLTKCGFLSFNSPTPETNALNCTPDMNCLAIDPATTLAAVSRAELRPPPL